MGATIDMAGQKFGRLMVETRAGSKEGRAVWNCVCDCGSRKVIAGVHLRRGLIKSCGCWTINYLIAPNIKHGKSRTRLHNIWRGMRTRCNNPNVKHYFRYGGRGIKICPEWDDFTEFESWAISAGYAEDLSIDRINNDGNYEPSNCQWVGNEVQSRNTRRNHIVDSPLGKMTLVELSKRTGIHRNTLLNRIKAGCKDQDLIRS